MINYKKIYSGILQIFTLKRIMTILILMGIIAYITIPAYIKNKQIESYKTLAKREYNKSVQAFTMTKAEGSYIPGQISYNNNQFDFKKNFMRKFKILKKCNKSNVCVASDKSGIVYKTLYGKNVTNQSHFSNRQFITKENVFYAIDDNGPEIFITVDVNGYNTQPNTFGVDTFMFFIDNNGNFKPMGTVDSDYTAASHCQRANWSTGWGCMYNVLQGADY